MEMTKREKLDKIASLTANLFYATRSHTHQLAECKNYWFGDEFDSYGIPNHTVVYILKDNGWGFEVRVYNRKENKDYTIYDHNNFEFNNNVEMPDWLFDFDNEEKNPVWKD